jgi:peptide/nickel transport system substrate-binding protein
MIIRIFHSARCAALCASFCAALCAALLACAKRPPAAELRFGFASEPASLDPLSAANTADGRSILFNVYEGLVKAGPAGDIEPAAAESWAVDGEAREYRFTLREGLRFSDGTPVRAQDAVFSLRLAVEAGFHGFSQIEKTEPLDERTITITLKESDPEFLPFLSIGIVPEANPDREARPIGTGPYAIESYTPQQALVLVRNPHYWKEGVPHLDKVIITFHADSNALLLALRGGGIDGAILTGSFIDQINPEKFDIFVGNSNAAQVFALNNTLPPLNDVRVRKALAYCIDQQELIDKAFFGRGEPSGSPLIPGLAACYEESLRIPYPTDLERARALLTEAGLAGGFPLEITVPSNYTMHKDSAEVIVDQLSRIGVRATIHLVDWGTWLSEVYSAHRFEATIISFDSSSGTVSPRSFLERYVSTTGQSNMIGFDSPAYDAAYRAALTERDEQKRIAFYKEAQRALAAEAGSVFIQDIKSFTVLTGGRYAGVTHYPIYVTDFANIYNRNVK